MFRKLLFTGALLVSSAAVAAPASKFLHDAIQGDNSESRLGALIAQRGSSAAVRAYGATLKHDHSTARVQAAGVARQMHIPAPTSMMPEARSEYSRLQHMHGAAFDREVKRYMIHDHQNDISEFQKQVHTGDHQTASLARAQLPVLRKHLNMAERLPG